MKSTDETIPAVYARTHTPLRSRVLRSVRGDAALADDILQETWLRAVQSWRAGGVPDRPAAWLARVARNVLLNALRRRRRAGVVSAEMLDCLPDNSSTADLSGSLETRERDAQLRRAIARLPRADAELLRAFYDRQTSVAGLAASLGVSDRAVEGRLRRARGKLRTELEAMCSRQPAGSQFPLLAPMGQSSGVFTLLERLFTIALLPFIALFAFVPLAFLVKRLSTRRLAILRIAAGVLMLIVATSAAPHAARATYVHLVQAGALATVLWGLWMLRRSPPGPAPTIAND